MTKIDYETKFADMSLDELVTFCEENDNAWNSDDGPEWDKHIEKFLKRALEKERNHKTLHELESIDIRMGKLGLEYIDASLRDAMDKSRPIGYLWDVIGEMKAETERIKQSVKVLLLKSKGEPSGATVDQMNVIKGGIPIR